MTCARISSRHSWIEGRKALISLNYLPEISPLKMYTYLQDWRMHLEQMGTLHKTITELIDEVSPKLEEVRLSVS